MEGGILYTTLVLGSGSQSRTSLRPRVDEGHLKPEEICHCGECAREKWRKRFNLGCHREWYTGFHASEKHWSFNADNSDTTVGLRLECFYTTYRRLLTRALGMYKEFGQSYTTSKCMYEKHGRNAVADMYLYRFLSKYVKHDYLPPEKQLEFLSADEQREAVRYTELAKSGRAALVEVKIDHILHISEVPISEDYHPSSNRLDSHSGLELKVSKLKVIHDIDQLLLAPNMAAINFIIQASPATRDFLHVLLDAIQYYDVRFRDFQSYQKRIAEILAFAMQHMP